MYTEANADSKNNTKENEFMKSIESVIALHLKETNGIFVCVTMCICSLTLSYSLYISLYLLHIELRRMLTEQAEAFANEKSKWNFTEESLNLEIQKYGMRKEIFELIILLGVG